MPDAADIQLVYDRQCPVCEFYCQHIDADASVGTLERVALTYAYAAKCFYRKDDATTRTENRELHSITTAHAVEGLY